MKKNFLSKLAIVAALATMTLSLAGCGSSEPNKETKKDDAAHVNMTIGGFASIDSVKEDCEFTLTYADDNGEQSVYGGKTFQGKYKLEADGEEVDIAVYDDGNTNIYIEVADLKLEFFADHISDVMVLNIDSTDDYKEIAVCDLGPSGDPTVHFFRYVDGVLYETGKLYGSEFKDILFDGQGKMIDGYAYIPFIEPKVVTEYVYVDEHIAKTYSLDISESLNKKYILTETIQVAFTETEDKTAYPDVSEIIELEKGEEITIIEAHPTERLYYVQLSDGRKGTMTTQLAG